MNTAQLAISAFEIRKEADRKTTTLPREEFEKFWAKRYRMLISKIHSQAVDDFWKIADDFQKGTSEG